MLYIFFYSFIHLLTFQQNPICLARYCFAALHQSYHKVLKLRICSARRFGSLSGTGTKRTS